MLYSPVGRPGGRVLVSSTVPLALAGSVPLASSGGISTPGGPSSWYVTCSLALKPVARSVILVPPLKQLGVIVALTEGGMPAHALPAPSGVTSAPSRPSSTRYGS